MSRTKQEERLDYLLDEFKKDSVTYRNLEVEDSFKEKRMALRSLMNIRAPKHMGEAVLTVQDAFLKEEAKEKGIVDVKDIPTVDETVGSRNPFADKIAVWQGDITRLKIGAIVNAANSQMLGCFVPCHRCIDNAIHSAAGIQLRNECNKLMNRRRMKFGPKYEEPNGQAMLTDAYNLPCDYVIHTVGPIVSYGLRESHKKDLQCCYESVLQCCVDKGIRTVAFCCISTGEFHFPNDLAAKIAVNTVSDFLKKNKDKFDCIVFNVFKDLDKELYLEFLR
jgi:O-acetyl-ADP-ribose deacetylase (regulator of RNase III)